MGEEGEESMSGGKAVPVAFMKAASDRRREDEDHRGAFWSTEGTPWRWRGRAEALVGQLRMAWLNVSGSVTNLTKQGRFHMTNSYYS